MPDLPRHIRMAVALSEEFEQYREFAYPDPASRLAKATRGCTSWGFKPPAEILQVLDANTAALPGDPWTVGYGQTKGVTIHSRMSSAEAHADAAARFSALFDRMHPLVRVDCTEPEWAAMLAFADNVGLSAFAGSTLLRKVNAGNKGGAAEEFKRWDKAQGEVMEGLARRRRAEREMFLGTHKLARRP